ncbi:MAG: Ig-like domain-containing protein, partial [Methanogenium sp.]|nr:Ig-like domain-containing protein [Methanogenium sp.]
IVKGKATGVSQLLRKILNCEQAVSPIIGFLLIVVILTSLLTNIQVRSVPVWNMEEEMQHLNVMYDDFKIFRSTIENTAVSGTYQSTPQSMGTFYSKKLIFYNPSAGALGTFDINRNKWMRITYDEIQPDGTIEKNIEKNITSSTITYSLSGLRRYNDFTYEYGLIRRGGNYTQSEQTMVSGDSIYLIGINATQSRETVASYEKIGVNAYPVSVPENSCLGTNIRLDICTDYPVWWVNTLNEMSGVTASSTGNIVYATFNKNMNIRMGEVMVSPSRLGMPQRLGPCRIMRVNYQGENVPVEGSYEITFEAQDRYNNPVPNVMINFDVNSSKPLGMEGSVSPASMITGADGRALTTLSTGGAGFYYIDVTAAGAATSSHRYTASSQGGVMTLSAVQNPSNPEEYEITATVKNSFDETKSNIDVSFAAIEGTVSPSSDITGASGNATTLLDVSVATAEEATVTAKVGYLFNYLKVLTGIKFNYVTSYIETLGTVTNFANARSASDSGAYAVIMESLQSMYPLVNGDFFSDAGSWTEVETTIPGIVGQTIWDESGYSNNGSIRLEATSKNKVYQAYRYQNVNITGGSTVRLNLAWKKGYTTAEPVYNYIYVTIKQPNGSEVDIWSNTTVPPAWDTWYTVPDLDVSSYFTLTGTYEIRLRCDLKTPLTAGAQTQAWFDEVNLTVGNYRYDVEFNASGVPSATTQTLDINYRVNSENAQMWVYNGTAWNNRATLSATAMTPYSYALQAGEYNGGDVRVRYVDVSQSMDAVQNSMDIEYHRINSK